ncbi:MAG: PLD nuclease N-terminal domain-containing protein [Acidimicrobiales bacterium]
MSRVRRALTVAASVVQLTLAIVAGVDLARRPASQVRGRKAAWAPILGVNFIGPLAYLCWGRVRTDSAVAESAPVEGVGDPRRDA